MLKKCTVILLVIASAEVEAQRTLPQLDAAVTSIQTQQTDLSRHVNTIYRRLDSADARLLRANNQLRSQTQELATITQRAATLQRQVDSLQLVVTEHAKTVVFEGGIIAQDNRVSLDQAFVEKLVQRYNAAIASEVLRLNELFTKLDNWLKTYR